MYNCIGKTVFNDHLGSSFDQCYIQYRVILNQVINRFMCVSSEPAGASFSTETEEKED